MDVLRAIDIGHPPAADQSLDSVRAKSAALVKRHGHVAVLPGRRPDVACRRRLRDTPFGAKRLREEAAMGEAIGEALPFAVGVAASPVPIIGVVLMLGTRRARSNGPAFALGWLLGLAVVGAVVLLVSNGAGVDEGRPSDRVNAVKLALGIISLVIAVRQWRSRPRPGEQPP